MYISYISNLIYLIKTIRLNANSYIKKLLQTLPVANYCNAYKNGTNVGGILKKLMNSILLNDEVNEAVHVIKLCLNGILAKCSISSLTNIFIHNTNLHAVLNVPYKSQLYKM